MSSFSIYHQLVFKESQLNFSHKHKCFPCSSSPPSLPPSFSLSQTPSLKNTLSYSLSLSLSLSHLSHTNFLFPTRDSRSYLQQRQKILTTSTEPSTTCTYIHSFSVCHLVTDLFDCPILLSTLAGIFVQTRRFKAGIFVGIQCN